MIILPAPKTIWFLSDHHLGHENILTFKRADGSQYRPEFGSIAEMHEALVERHNSVVRDRDHVYFMGDVAMKLTDEVKGILNRMRGRKRLIRGNHDVAKTRSYTALGFEEIHALRVLGDVIFTHIPIHPMCINSRWLGNAHGHVHYNTLSDPRYLNLSCEVQDYTPVSLDTVRGELNLRTLWNVLEVE